MLAENALYGLDCVAGMSEYISLECRGRWIWRLLIRRSILVTNMMSTRTRRRRRSIWIGRGSGVRHW